MSLLDDTAVFAAVIQEGGFSHAAKYLGLSNGLISRRIAQLEAKLGVTLIKRTTRQLTLTPEGELLWEHAQRIQQELNSALGYIQSLAEKPTGIIRISAPLFFGRHYIVPTLIKFQEQFSDIQIDLNLSNERFDPIKEKLDLVIRGAGYLENPILKDSSLQVKILMKGKINLYASHAYLEKYGMPSIPNDLLKHRMIGTMDKMHLPNRETWAYTFEKKNSNVIVEPKFNCNDIESGVRACVAGVGIGKFLQLHVKEPMSLNQLQRVLPDYNWGCFHLYAIYAHQQALPRRTRLLLDFINAELQPLTDKNSNCL